MHLIPASVHRGILKSYANFPALSLKAGFRAFPQTYYSPLVDPNEIDVSRLGQKRDLPGIHIRHGYRRANGPGPELLFRPNSHGCHWTPKGQVVWNETFTTIDSSFLYCLLRHLKPRRYIEVGCGVSSRVASEALRKNHAEGHRCAATFIEPYPGPRLEGFQIVW